MKQALSAWIDQEKERSQLTREALADVDTGLVVDHQAVQAWANSLSTDDPSPLKLPTLLPPPADSCQAKLQEISPEKIKVISVSRR